MTLKNSKIKNSTVARCKPTRVAVCYVPDTDTLTNRPSCHLCSVTNTLN